MPALIARLQGLFEKLRAKHPQLTLKDCQLRCRWQCCRAENINPCGS